MPKIKRTNNPVWYLCVLVIFLVVFIGKGNYSYAQEKKERDFSISTQFTKLVVQRETELKLEVRIANMGKRKEDIYLSVIPGKKASNWDASLKALYGAVKVQALYLPSEEPDNVVNLEFRTTPPREAPAGEYDFLIQGITKDKKLKRTLKITLVLEGKAWKPLSTPEPTSKDIKLLVDYPQIKRAAGSNFEFEIEVKNDTSKDLVFDLIPSAPAGWSGYTTPRWKKEEILALKINRRSSEFVKLVLIPPFHVSEGEYPVEFKVRAGELSQAIKLKAIVTGTYKLKAATKTGQLNLDVVAGKKESFPIYLWNEGSASITDISFFSREPEGWKVTFSPNKLPSLSPVREVGKPEKIEVTIESKPKAIPGDYMVTLTATGMQDRVNMDMRVTVRVPTTWGWIGVVIVIAVIGMLIGIFLRLKRR